MRPDTDAHNRAVVSRSMVNGLWKEEQAGNQTFLVHTVAGSYVITGGNDTAVPGSPVHRISFVVTCPLHASWEYIDVTHKVFFPVHRTSRNDCIVRTDVGGAGTRFCLLYTHGGYGSQCNSYCLYWFIHLAFVFMINTLFHRVTKGEEYSLRKRGEIPYSSFSFSNSSIFSTSSRYWAASIKSSFLAASCISFLVRSILFPVACGSCTALSGRQPA